MMIVTSLIRIFALRAPRPGIVEADGNPKTERLSALSPSEKQGYQNGDFPRLRRAFSEPTTRQPIEFWWVVWNIEVKIV